MPIFDIKCSDCGYSGEVLVLRSDETFYCPACGSQHATKYMSPSSSLTGREGQKMPGMNDTACCGSRPGEAQGCAGPGSCCGKSGYSGS
jgi:putative FmdB family regulatory protein